MTIKQLFTDDFPSWSPQAASLWAKTDRSDDQSTDWLNLPQHMMDSAQVGAYLWSHYLSENHRRFIQEQLALSSEDCQRFVAFLCGSHDVGKASQSFASQLNESSRYSFLADQIRATGLNVPSAVPSDQWSPHSAASYIILTRFFDEKFGQSSYRTLFRRG
ncbi:HD domain-containing protein [Rothia nasimurium]|uniref:HD domain-containing protein n=1 Tax=Rothia nasimurium TaxID=85336 RepID=UPI003C6E586A